MKGEAELEAGRQIRRLGDLPKAGTLPGLDPARRGADWGAWRPIAAVVAVALVARLVVVAVMNATGYRTYIFAGDSAVYAGIARELLAGHGYRYPDGSTAANIPPLFTFVVAGIYRTLGEGTLQIGLVNALLGAFSVLVLYLIGRAVFGEKVGLLSALLLALYPIQLFNTAYVLKEILGILLTLLGVLGFVALDRRASARVALATGIVAALATLARYVSLGLFATLGLVALATGSGRRWRWLGSGVLMSVALALTLLPWIVYNTQVYGRPLLTPHGPGAYLYTSNGPGLVGETWGYYEARGLVPLDADHKWGADYEGDAIRKTLDHAVQDPGHIAQLVLAKAINMWRPTWAGASLPNQIVFGGSYLLLMALSILGMVTARRVAAARPLYGAVAFYVVIHLVYWGMIRERQYVEPYLMLFASYGLVRLYGSINELRR